MAMRGIITRGSIFPSAQIRQAYQEVSYDASDICTDRQNFSSVIKKSKSL